MSDLFPSPPLSSPLPSLPFSSNRNCEFLKKLDLTVNFVDLDELEESITHLQSRLNLKDLYMMGNPAETNWPNFKSFVIAKLPQLRTLDGTEITKSMRIIATQSLPSLEVTLSFLPLPEILIHFRWNYVHLLQQNVLKKLLS